MHLRKHVVVKHSERIERPRRKTFSPKTAKIKTEREKEENDKAYWDCTYCNKVYCDSKSISILRMIFNRLIFVL